MVYITTFTLSVLSPEENPSAQDRTALVVKQRARPTGLSFSLVLSHIRMRLRFRNAGLATGRVTRRSAHPRNRRDIVANNSHPSILVVREHGLDQIESKRTRSRPCPTRIVRESLSGNRRLGR